MHPFHKLARILETTRPDRVCPQIGISNVQNGLLFVVAFIYKGEKVVRGTQLVEDDFQLIHIVSLAPLTMPSQV